MMSFRGRRLAELSLSQGIVWLLESLSESKGRQQLFEHKSPQILKTLRELALIESAESSNRLEGVTVDRKRLRPLVLGHALPRDRPEEEIVGYRRALDWIHTKHTEIDLSPATCLRLHELAQGGTTGNAGVWKAKPNDIIEILPDGRREIRFRPLAPELVDDAMQELFLAYHHSNDQRLVTPLVSLSALVLDFTCIHPFRDGNGRVSRLLLLLALYHQGFDVGRYVSLERVVEQTKEDYYATLKQSSQGWHTNDHDVKPWFRYVLTVLRMSYREYEERANRIRPRRGEKTDLVETTLQNMHGPFGIADVEANCPNVSRALIRRVMNRWRKAKKLHLLGRGRDARWKKTT